MKYNYFKNEGHMFRYMKTVLNNYIRKYPLKLTDLERAEVFDNTLSHVYVNMHKSYNSDKGCAKNYLVTSLLYRAMFEIKIIMREKNRLGLFGAKCLDADLSHREDRGRNAHSLIADESIYPMEGYLDCKEYAQKMHKLIESWKAGKMTIWDYKVRDRIRQQAAIQHRKTKGNARMVLPRKFLTSNILKMYGRILEQIIITDDRSKLACLQEEFNTTRANLYEAKKRMYAHLYQIPWVQEAKQYLGVNNG